jgi:ribosomal protein S18 acetylase RimI-like enzyme
MNMESKEKDLKIEIVPAGPEDVRGIAEVLYKTWLATYPNDDLGITKDDIEDVFKDSFTDEMLAKRAERIRQLPKNETSLLAKDEGRIVGLCNVIRHPDKNQLKAIYVLPEYQGKGIGTLLWAEAQKHFDAGKNTIVHVVTYNVNAIGFYKKLGFKETGRDFIDARFKMKSGVRMPETEMEIAYFPRT